MEETQKDRQPPPYFAGLLDAIARGATVVTPGRRAANRLARQVDAATAMQGHSSWRAARILPWTAWVGAHWDSALLHGLETRIILTRTQELTLWESVILQDGRRTGQAAQKLAEFCVRPSALLSTYAASEAFGRERLGGSHSTDAAVFHHWYVKFNEQCAREGYLAAAALEHELTTLVRQRRIPVEPEVLLFGFPDFSPSRTLLLEAMREAGSSVEELNIFSMPTSTPQYLHYADREAELRACVQWVRNQLERTPQHSIRIVVPDLPAVRDELQREFRMAVSPGNANVMNTAAAAYEFSSGMPLHSIPLIREALLVLRWSTDRLLLEDAAALLRSDHLALTASPESGASLEEAKLRSASVLRKEFSLREASELLQQHSASQVLLHLHGQAAELQSSSNSFAYFAAQVQNLLRTAGWPGRNPMDAEELAAVDAWQGALDAVASLDLFGKKTTWAAFLQKLKACLESAEVTPAFCDLPIQITSMEEAFGRPVDAMWFLHAEANTWPAQIAPSALLPLALQREFGMPGVDSQRDEDAAAVRLESLIQSSADVVNFSVSGDQEQDAGRPSPVVQRVLFSNGVHSLIEALPTEPDHSGPLLETFVDTTPLPSLPETELYGGVSILTAQAQCGFRAWAEKRLFSTSFEEAETGLSPRERGDQVHRVLQAFWAATQNQQTLRTNRMTFGADGLSERDRLLQACIAEECAVPSVEGWDDAYLAVQKQRLFRLLSGWLDYEEKRPPFEVLHLEHETRNVPIGPLKLHMRVDRIDRVLASADDNDEDLGTLLIDYKTGSKSNSPKDWSGDRPEQPQLPAYATAAIASAGLGTLNGIAFAAVRAGTNKMKLHGLAEPGLLPSQGQKGDVSFTARKEEWLQHLGSLAQAFADGAATVAPKTFPRTCDTCGQRLLCRLDAATLLGADMDDPDSSDREAE